MSCLTGLRKFWTKLHRKQKATDYIEIKLEEPIKLEPGVYEVSTRPHEPFVIRKMGSQAGKQDIGRFMKHGHQAPWYRKSVKAKVQPEEDEDEDYFDEQENPAD